MGKNTQNWEENFKTAQKIAKISKQKVGIDFWCDEGLSFDSWVTIRTEDRKIDYSTIAKKIRKVETRYIVEIAVVRSGYPLEPDDVCEEEVADYQSIEEAIKKAILIVVENELDYAIEGISMGQGVLNE